MACKTPGSSPGVANFELTSSVILAHNENGVSTETSFILFRRRHETCGARIVKGTIHENSNCNGIAFRNPFANCIHIHGNSIGAHNPVRLCLCVQCITRSSAKFGDVLGPVGFLCKSPSLQSLNASPESGTGVPPDIARERSCILLQEETRSNRTRVNLVKCTDQSIGDARAE